MNITLRKFPYSYLPYEERFLQREAESIGKVAKSEGEKIQVTVLTNDAEPILGRLHHLTYFSHFRIGNGPMIPTQQFLMETTANGGGNASRQSTRYSTHGLHDYKGKFHPQIARYLMGRSGLSPESAVLDPFAGSGTVLVEAVHYGCSAIGVEANPLAALVANSKLQLLTCSERDLKRFQRDIEKCLYDLAARKHVEGLAARLEMEEPVLEYLQSWFAPAVLVRLLEFRCRCREAMDSQWCLVADAVLSSIAREVSQQDPADLRIRRRKEPLNEAPVAEYVSKSISTLITRTIAARNLFGDNPAFAKELVGDSRELASVLRPMRVKPVDAIITSPPYATALPYIDTSRLSLVLTGLCTASELRQLERRQIGNREISPSERKAGEHVMEKQLLSLPKNIQEFIRRLVRKQKNCDAGFRKLNMPVLLVQYFSDMSAVISQTHRVLAPGGSSYWVVGPNRTSAGGDWLNIDTPHWIASIAECIGFSTAVEQLDAYQRFGLHQKNGIREEFLVSMKRG